MGAKISKAFCLGFEKRAASLETLRHAASKLKKHVVKRRILFHPLKGEARVGKKPLKGELSYGRVTAGPGALKDKRMEGKIFAKGDSSKDLRPLLKYNPELGAKLPKSGRDKEALNHLFLLHEGSELRHGAVNKGKTQWGAGHNSPKVIFEDSNMVATLPKEHQAVKDFSTAQRGAEKDLLEKHIPGFQYGKQRYSRHAIKRMTESLERQGVGVRPRE